MKKILPRKLGSYIFRAATIASFFFAPIVYAGTLSCSVTTSAACTGTVIYRMSGSSNAHAELPSQSTVTYNSNVVCCAGVTGLSNSCTAPSATALILSGITNAHSQINTQTGYVNNACISVPSGGSVSVGYVTDPTTCVGAGYDTTLGTINSNTNSHVGNTTAYTTKICATASAGAVLLSNGVLTSSVFDTTSSSTSIGYNSIMWKGLLGGAGFNEGKVLFQLAASNLSTGPWNYYGGATCGALDWFETTGPDSPIELKGTSCVSNWNNKRYFRYKVKICSNDCVTGGSNTPTINKVIVNWSS